MLQIIIANCAIKFLKNVSEPKDTMLCATKHLVMTALAMKAFPYSNQKLQERISSFPILVETADVHCAVGIQRHKAQLQRSLLNTI
ncbi:hypothetical protein YC68_23965 [Vibrio parahaemolyticus]|nr:hypothetical protein YC68_23965 [Vibrio parahaemolyticus]